MSSKPPSPDHQVPVYLTTRQWLAVLFWLKPVAMTSRIAEIISRQIEKQTKEQST